MNDAVHKPKHYQLWEDMEVIDVIKKVLTPEEFNGYCKGNILKYKLRAGNKDAVQQELGKANKYKEFLEDVKVEDKDNLLPLPETPLRIRELWGDKRGERVPLALRTDLRCPCGSAYIRESATHHSCSNCGRVWYSHHVEEIERAHK